MKLFSKKSTFVLGGILGSIAGLLFANESGKNFRARLKTAPTPQKKFEAIFKEYLKVGKDVFKEIEESEVVRDIVKGGKEILAELKKKAKREGTEAVKLAEKKTTDLIKAAEWQIRNLQGKGAATVKRTLKKSKQLAKKEMRQVKNAARRKLRKFKK